MKQVLSSAVVVALCATQGAWANDAESTYSTPKKWSASIGAAVVSSPDYKGSDDYETTLYPWLSASYQVDSESQVFFNREHGLGYKTKIRPDVVVGVKADIRSGRDSSDNAKLAGMRDVDDALEIGTFAEFKTTENTSILAEVSYADESTNQGVIVEVGALHKQKVAPDARLTAFAKIAYGSEDVNQAHFGVKASEALPSRPAYNAGAGFNEISAGGMVSYTPFVDKHHALVMGVNASQLIGDAADSPIVKDKTSLSGFLGYVYNF